MGSEKLIRFFLNAFSVRYGSGRCAAISDHFFPEFDSGYLSFIPAIEEFQILDFILQHKSMQYMCRNEI